MAKHEFGIMRDAPRPGERFDAYKPWKYEPVAVVDDEFVEPLSFTSRTLDMDAYWHTLDVPGKGLAYTGITLIPPTSLPRMLEVLRGREGFEALLPLLARALEEGRFVIHFGI